MDISSKTFFRRSIFYLPAWVCLAVLILVMASLPGCAGKKDAVKKDESAIQDEQRKEAAEKKSNYQDALNKWTRSKKIYEGVEARLYITATYKAMEFREAYIDRYVKSYQLGPVYRQTLLEREKEQEEKYNEFFFTAFTPEERWNDFHRSDSIWKMYLEDDAGARMIPISITRIDSSDPVIREFFPYFDLWSQGYVARFPKYTETGIEPLPGPNTKFFRIVVTGVLGKGELEWRLKE